LPRERKRFAHRGPFYKSTSVIPFRIHDAFQARYRALKGDPLSVSQQAVNSHSIGCEQAHRWKSVGLHVLDDSSKASDC
jgi:hypothetical protein